MPTTLKSAIITSNFTVTETLGATAPFADVTKDDITHTKLNDTRTYTPTSTPAANMPPVLFQQALTAGAATIDLRSLVGSDGAAIDGNGKKVRAFKFRNPATNANPITITFGASNGYLMLGAGWKIILQPGQHAIGDLADGAPAIDGTHKTIDLAGTLAQALDVGLILG